MPYDRKIADAPGGVNENTRLIADALNRMRRNAVENGASGSQLVTVYDDERPADVAGDAS